MKTRIITGLLLTTLAAAVIYFCGPVLALVATVLVSMAQHEEYQALRKGGHDPAIWPNWAATAVCTVIVVFLDVKYLIPALIVTVLADIGVVVFRKEPSLEDLLTTFLPLLSVMLPGLCIVAIMRIEPLSMQRTLTGMMIAVPVLGDTLAYFIGSKVRGPKLCPPVSPNKTISGAVAGMAGSVLAAVLIRAVAGALCVPTTPIPTWLDTLMLGFLGGIASQLGDLFASMVKRHCGVKDFSHIFPGHGGVMDRLDSILFMAVMMMAYWVFH